MKLDEITLRNQTVSGDDYLTLHHLLEIAKAFARTLEKNKLDLGEDWKYIRDDAEKVITRLGSNMDQHIQKVQSRYQRRFSK